MEYGVIFMRFTCTDGSIHSEQKWKNEEKRMKKEENEVKAMLLSDYNEDDDDDEASEGLE
jgi:hypothetical protein